MGTSDQRRRCHLARSTASCSTASTATASWSWPHPGWPGAPDRCPVLSDDVGGAAGHWRLALRGPDEPGAAVVADHRGQPLLLASPLLELDQEELLALANATDLEDEPEPPQPKKTSASA